MGAHRQIRLRGFPEGLSGRRPAGGSLLASPGLFFFPFVHRPESSNDKTQTTLSFSAAVILGDIDCTGLTLSIYLPLDLTLENPQPLQKCAQKVSSTLASQIPQPLLAGGAESLVCVCKSVHNQHRGRGCRSTALASFLRLRCSCRRPARPGKALGLLQAAPPAPCP